VARARRRRRTEVSLFPFLSVLACTIGALTLIITATATSQVAAGGIDIERYERLEREIAAGRLELAALELLEREQAELAARLDEAGRRADALAGERAALGEPLAPDDPLSRSLRDGTSRVEALERELAERKQRSARLRGEVDARRKRLANAPIRIRPSGSGFGLAPRFIECRRDGIVLFESPDWKGRRIPTVLAATSPELTRFLQRAKFQEAGTVIFLVREGGVTAHDVAAARASRLGVRSGRMPVAGDGPLDFSAVDRS
jgi:predicted RNase H-like nuclease (RuvC/YqgF family)